MLGPFTEYGPTYSPARTSHRAVIFGNQLVVLGGLAGDTSQYATTALAVDDISAIDLAQLPSGGGSFASVGHLAVRRYGHTSFAAGNRIYSLGGDTPLGDPNGQSASRDVEYVEGGNYGAPVLSADRLNQARAFHGLALAPLASGSQAVYVLGGLFSAPLASIEQATVDPSGVLSSFSYSATALSSGRSGVDGAVVGPCLYATGGEGQGSLQYTYQSFRIDPSTGALSAGASGPLQTARSGHASVVFGNDLYLVGGTTSWSTGYFLDVVDRYRSDPGTCTLSYLDSPTALPQARWGGPALAWSDASGTRALYVGGVGHNPGTGLSQMFADVAVAPLLP